MGEATKATCPQSLTTLFYSCFWLSLCSAPSPNREIHLGNPIKMTQGLEEDGGRLEEWEDLREELLAALS